MGKAVLNLLDGEAQEAQDGGILEQEAAGLMDIGAIQQRHEGEFAEEQFFRHIPRPPWLPAIQASMSITVLAQPAIPAIQNA